MRGAARLVIILVAAHSLACFLLISSAFSECIPVVQWAAINASAIYEDVVVQGNGDVVVVGNKSSQLCLVKYGNSGTLLWEIAWDIYNNKPDHGYAVDITDNNEIAVAGFAAYDYTTRHSDFLVQKYDAEGNLIWSRATNSSSDKWAAAHDVEIDSANNIIAAGYEDTSGDLSAPYGVIRKYDPVGNLLWTRTASNVSYYRRLETRPDGSILCVGTITMPPETGFVWLVRKYGSDGSLIWTRTHTTTYGSDSARAVRIEPSGNIIVAGNYQRSSYGNDHGLVVRKYDTDGNDLQTIYMEQSLSLQESIYGIPTDMFLDDAGNLFCGWHWWKMTKHDPTGKFLWMDQFRFVDSYSTCNGLFIKGGSLYACGRAGSYDDPFIGRLEKLPATGEPFCLEGDEGLRGHIYPNPVSGDSTTIVFENADSSNASQIIVEVLNALYQPVIKESWGYWALADKTITLGGLSVLAPGVYFIRVRIIYGDTGTQKTESLMPLVIKR